MDVLPIHGNVHMYVKEGTAFRSGQRYTNFYCTSFKTNIYGDSVAPISIVLHLKLTSMSVKNMHSKPHLTDVKSSVRSLNCVWSQNKYYL